jgi:membrane fusion protein, multidrug efflux system
VDPVYVDFYIPQQKISSVGVNHDLIVLLDDANVGSLPGKVTAIAPEVDRASRNLWMRGTLANPEGILKPGMFVQVEVMEPKVKEVIAIPATAVIYAPYGNSVFIVEEEEGKLVARQRIVRLGETRGDFVEVVSGLDGGETLVTTGAFKLRNGSFVTPNNDKGLEFSLTPTPPNA